MIIREETIKRTNAFWEKEVMDRPLVCVTAPIGTPDVKVSLIPTEGYNACMNEKYSDILDTYASVVDNTFYGGEAVPSFDATIGPDQYAGFLGGKILSKDGYITTWASETVEDWSDFEVKIHKEQDGYFSKMLKYIRYAVENYGDRFLVNMLDLHSNMDALSALRGPQNLCMDLYDCPEEVMRVLSDVRKTYKEIYDAVYEAGKMEERGTIGWHPIYSQKKSGVIQCDFSCMISPELAKKYVIPAIIEEASYVDHTVYHYDGKEALGHLDYILDIPEIDCIQWVPGDGQPRTIEWMELLQKIQSRGKSLWINDWTVEEIKANFKQLKPELTAFSVSAGSRDEAESLLEAVKL